MKSQKSRQGEWQTDNQSTKKKPYEPPKAILVPLEMEERLLMCNWVWKGACVKQR